MCNNQKQKKTVADYPHLVEQWDWEANGDLRPEDFTYGSAKEVGWKCSRGHMWQMVIKNRTIRCGKCPFCSHKRICKDNNLLTVFPLIAKEWNYELNKNLRPEDCAPFSHRKVWWICDRNHIWQAQISSRTQYSTRCPYCVGKCCEDNNLTITHPQVANEWDYEKNSLGPEFFTFGSSQMAHWKCTKGHKLQATVCYRTHLMGCPFCLGERPSEENNFLIKYPDLAVEWDVIKNGDLKPEQFTFSSHEKVWWKCDKSHSWCATINSRTASGNGCPNCRKSRGENAIKNILQKLNITYFTETRIPSCRSIKPLPFDFVVRMSHCFNKPWFIEYQGEQHYKPTYFGSAIVRQKGNSIEKFEELQKRDRIKTQWCREHNFSLLIIPYNETNHMEKLIKEFLGLDIN